MWVADVFLSEIERPGSIGGRAVVVVNSHVDQIAELRENSGIFVTLSKNE